MQKKYTIGIDYGTLSARAVALDLATGEEVTEAVFVYPHAVMDRELPSGKKLPAQFALQHPQDYLDALKNTIGGVLKTISKEEIVGICIDLPPAHCCRWMNRVRPCASMRRLPMIHMLM